MGCMRYSIEVFCILAATVIKQDYTFLTERWQDGKKMLQFKDCVQFLRLLNVRLQLNNLKNHV